MASKTNDHDISLLISLLMRLQYRSLQIILFLAGVLFSAGLYAEIPDSLYYKANEKYQEGRFEEAIQLYQSVIDRGYESPVLYYNLGNAFFRSNKLGKSRLYYEKALKLDPQMEDAWVNLALVENLLVDKFEEIPVFFLKRWYKSFIRLLTSNNWALISLISFIFAFMSFSIYLLVRQTGVRKTGFFSGLVFFMISLLTFMFSWQQKNNEILPQNAIVTEYLVNVKSAPRDTGTDLFVLHEGTKVWLEDSAADWMEIRLSDGRKGWLPSSSIEEI